MNLFVQSRRVLPFVALIALFGCGAAPSTSGENTGEVGEVQLELTTVPTGVQCLQIVATGASTVTKNIAATAGSSGVNYLPLGALPVGNVTITGKAFNVSCGTISGQTATWIADSLTINVQAGVITSPTITFRPYNTVTATANFVGNVVQVATSVNASYIVYADGTVRGAGNLSPLGLGQQASFIALSSLTNVASIALGQYDFGCALLKTGTVSCWGANAEGELGNGTTQNSTTLVAATGMTTVVQVTAGNQHACALKSDGTLWCWGGNRYGQIGNGSTTNSATPVQANSHVTHVSAGLEHTCAAMMGLYECWGQNYTGQLGDGTTTASSVPTSSYELNAVTQVVAGSLHSCALRASGDVFCWGSNAYGQLGNGNTTQLTQPSTIPALSGVQQLATTRNGTCALLKGGYVQCWGADFSGEAGDGTGRDGIVLPTYVSNNYATFTNLFQGSGLTNCAIGSDAKAYCWGSNGAGLFGNGNSNDVWVPTALGI